MNKYNNAYNNLSNLNLLNTKELEHIKLASMKESIYKNGDLLKEKKKIVKTHIKKYKVTYIIDLIIYFPLFAILLTPFLFLIYYLLFYIFSRFSLLSSLGDYLIWITLYFTIYLFIQYFPFTIFKISRLFKNKLQLDEIA